MHQYAQRIISTPGKQDGLYWKNADGTDGGPISEAVAKAIEEGYAVETRSAYHGYIFQVLKGQGPAAPLGELDYVIGGAMIGGFALIATPAEYGVTGVQTFIINHDGIVYQKDLGPTRWRSPKRSPATTPTRRGPARTTRGRSRRETVQNVRGNSSATQPGRFVGGRWYGNVRHVAPQPPRRPRRRTTCLPTSSSGNSRTRASGTSRRPTKRAQALKDMAKKFGATVNAVDWTLGQYHIATIVDAPDDTSVNALLLSVGTLGNVRTQTLRAFSADEMGQILGRMA